MSKTWRQPPKRISYFLKLSQPREAEEPYDKPGWAENHSTDSRVCRKNLTTPGDGSTKLQMFSSCFLGSEAWDNR